MKNKLDNLIELMKKDLRLFLSISFGVFVFVLFFQPFPLERFDLNNNLLFVAGLAGIVFFLMNIIYIIVPWSFNYKLPSETQMYISIYFAGFMLAALSSVAFAFYLRYVGWVTITFYIMFKVALLCLAPPIVLRFLNSYLEIRSQNESLLKEMVQYEQQIKNCEESGEQKSISFISEYGSENLSLPVSDVVLMKSADNYVEIFFLEEGNIKKKLIRSTMKNIEFQLKPYPVFTRCHRTCIVNTSHVEKLHKKFHNHSLSMIGIEETIPVSRQYLIKLKELL